MLWIHFCSQVVPIPCVLSFANLGSRLLDVRAHTSSEQAQLRKLILEAAMAAGKGHIGSALSISDLLLATEQTLGEFFSDQPAVNVVLSKGHAASALYALMTLRGVLSRDELLTYCADGSVLGTHPSPDLAGVRFASGSLGQGLGVAAGLAVADKLRKLTRQTVCIMSDAELNEGSVWEALLFAAHHRLENLVVLIDMNGQQALGYTEDVLDTEGVQAAAEAFGWVSETVDGHDVDAVSSALSGAQRAGPLLLRCRTRLGNGVSFMEGRIEWHYLPMTEEQFQQALYDVDGGDLSAK